MITPKGKKPLHPIFVNDIKALKKSGVDREEFADTMEKYVNDVVGHNLLREGETKESLLESLLACYDEYQPDRDKPISYIEAHTKIGVVLASIIEKLSAQEQIELGKTMEQSYKTGGDDGEGWIRLPPKIQKMLNEYRGTPDLVDSIRLIDNVRKKPAPVDMKTTNERGEEQEQK